MKTTIKKLEKSEVEITGAIPAEQFMGYEAEALASLGEKMEIPGFRKGKAPANLVKGAANEMMILEEMAELALYAEYPKILEENKIDAIGRPQISITKIAKGNDLEFKIITAVLPEVTLPDYKKLASEEIKKNPEVKAEVSDAEVEKVLLDLRKMRAHQKQHEGEKPARPHEGAGGEGEEHNHDHGEVKEEDLPVVDDAFAKSFGEFADLEAFKNKIRENVKMEKEVEQKDKLRLAIVEVLIEKSKAEIPEILIDAEANKILYKLEADVTNMGLKFEDYLKQVGKTPEGLKKDWWSEAEKRAKLQIIIHAISEKENLKADEEEIVKEVTNITTMYKDADPVRARAYIEQMLNNEKVFAFLEKQ